MIRETRAYIIVADTLLMKEHDTMRTRIAAVALLVASCLLVGCRYEVEITPEMKGGIESEPSTTSDDAATIEPGTVEPEVAPDGPETAPVEAAAFDPALEVVPAADDWPWWRGPGRNNVAVAEQDPPTEWSESKNILWKGTVPGRGHGTPCLWGEKIFLATGDKDEETITVLCYARDSGKKQWATKVYRGDMPKIHTDNSHASATIACDGERVFFPYQTESSVRVAALDLDGKIVWDKESGPYESVQGYSGSPTLFQGMVMVVGDASPGIASKLTAFDRKTGEIAWQVDRPSKRESYASALVAKVAGRHQLMIVGPDDTRSYDPLDGKLLWECKGPAEYCDATVAFSDTMVYSTGGWPQRALLGIPADGTDGGFVEETWKSDKKAGYVPSPLYADGLVYAVADKTGLMRCYDAASGDVVWEEKLDGMYYSSPVLVGDKLYLFDREKGLGYIMKAGREFEILATNTLPKGAFATPVITRNRIYLRTLGDFYCIGKSE